MADAVRSCAVRRWWRGLAVVGLVSGAFVAVAQPAAASQFTVTTVADSGAGSLRQAVLDANANAGPDEIVFDPSIDTQAITLTSGELVVTDELTVTGNGATNTIIDGNGTDGIFHVTALVPLTVGGATLQNGVASSDGGAINSNAAVTVDSTVVTDNSAPGGSGGGIAALDVTIRNGSVVRANHASVGGGGAWSTSGDVIVTDSTIGGASVPDGNTSGGNIGGVGASQVSGGATITNSTVSHNTATGSGGGVDGPAGVVISGSTISSNNNVGIFSGGPLVVTDSTVSSNTSDGVGGGALSFSATTITGSWFDQNTAAAAGAAFTNLGSDTTTSISNSTFSNNQQTDVAGFGGGGIALADVNATLTNVTLNGNTAAGSIGGGGIAVLTQGGLPSPDLVTIDASTIDGNSGGGIAVAPNAPATSVGSTILSNTTGPACDGAITDAGFNLLFNTTAGSCVFDAANDVTGADPELSALTLNAPATLVPTMALSATSPGLDVVTSGCPPPATDARGVTRPQGDACDAGAFELEVAPPPTTIVTTTADSGVGSLRQAVLDANGNAGPDEITFDPNINTQTITLTSGELSVTDPLTVTGNGAANTVIDGNGTDRIFLVSGLVPFTISGATLQNGVTASGDGGAIDSDGPVTVDASTITGNSTSGDGGGVAAADVTIRNGSVVRANDAGGDGGGALALNGDITVTGSTIGGASVSDANTAGDKIGGVGVPFGGTGTVTITSSTVSHNAGGTAAGGVGSPGVVVITGSTISSNIGTGIVSAGALTITDSRVSSNTGQGAGGGAIGFADATITGSWFDQNTATFAGGGFANPPADSTTSISDSTFSNNQQTDPGGLGGGGIAFGDVNATLSNVTVSGNTAASTSGGGGGILVLTQTPGTPSPDSVTIGSSTIDGNAGGGISVLADAPATSVGTTILSNNTGGPGCDGVITDSGFNLLFNTTAGSCVFDAANDVTGAEPALDALTLNAPAAIVPTMALSAGSPALDVVTTGCPPPAADARGVTRPQGDACDIGAFELAVTPPPPTTTTTTGAVAPATGEAAGSGESGTLPFTGGPGPSLALLGATLLALGALLEYGPRARRRALRHARG